MATSNNQKKQYIKEYIRSLKAIEDCIEPYQEQKRELRSEFRNNGWLNTDEIRAAVKAYRLFKGKVNIDEVVENFDRATNLREVKLVYSTLAESFGTKVEKKEIKESKGMASKPVASTKSEKQEEILSEGEELRNRFKKLAGII